MAEPILLEIVLEVRGRVNLPCPAIRPFGDLVGGSLVMIDSPFQKPRHLVLRRHSVDLFHFMFR